MDQKSLKDLKNLQKFQISLKFRLFENNFKRHQNMLNTIPFIYNKLLDNIKNPKQKTAA